MFLTNHKINTHTHTKMGQISEAIHLLETGDLENVHKKVCKKHYRTRNPGAVRKHCYHNVATQNFISRLLDHRMKFTVWLNSEAKPMHFECQVKEQRNGIGVFEHLY